MSKLLTMDWSDSSAGWLEEHLQMALVQWLERNGYLFDVGLEGAARSSGAGARLKLLGMRRGVPDLRIYLPMGKLCSIELKTASGTLSKEQIARHSRMVELGFAVHTVVASCPQECIDKVAAILHS